YTPAATASSGLGVSIALDSLSSGCTLSSGVVHFTGVGTCLVDATQSGDASYTPAPQVQQSITVNKATQTVAFTSTPPSSPQVNGTYAATATGAASSNPVILTIDGSSTSGCTIDSTGNVTFHGPAGTCVIDANQAGDANYTAAPQVQQSITVAKASQTISFTS